MLAATNANPRMFWLYMSAAKAFNIDVESEISLPNMRLLLGHYKTALRLVFGTLILLDNGVQLSGRAHTMGP
ncbi:hypothetical protein Pmar_PMAR028150 [Perkinsus marinus ATCC 50983]|uniref:Uncharacterized protein n=1 Tax=Perkinsus marinus (strain ATCC 50983 / TXsc) TaxID=423536 RepID=C5LB37_PERM5|nr:hypothetical protein Pmar_PMAR028150 [Perkinsus marinus ATCC 50983]EER05965.1 hypothetical protein Pmar_PMAR028150 [Perkinsus marinus ATCC 50983]|eukprot:XP_002774149.1 hypothetical protein Pmar_PMAR028150 [Perkinsus marinus ATCC 50983]